MHLDNDWYGHRRVLSAYCGTPNRPAFATILHGWIWNVDPARGHRRLTSAPYLLWNYRNLIESRRHGLPNADAIGAPYLYLEKLNPKRVTTSAGTVLFPQHCTDTARFQTHHQHLIASVERTLPGPYTVSIFFAEPQFTSIERLYEAAGWQVFCAGPRSAPDFLERLHDCLARHAYTVSNDLSTSIFYAGYLGRGVQVLRDHLWENSIVRRMDADRGLQRMAQTLYEGVEGSDARVLGERELGADLMLSPDELRRRLGWNSLVRSSAAAVVARLVDLKYGRAIRRGYGDLRTVRVAPSAEK
jgi:hypothetical protein